MGRPIKVGKARADWAGLAHPKRDRAPRKKANPAPVQEGAQGETPETDAVDDEIREARMTIPHFERDGGSLRLMRLKARSLERRLRAREDERMEG